MESLEQNYRQQLETLDATAPPITGVLFRKKDLNVAVKLPYILFVAQKYILYKNYKLEKVILLQNQTRKVEPGVIIVPTINNSRFVITFLCFASLNSNLQLAIFQNNEYVHFMTVAVKHLKLDTLEHFKNINVIIKTVEYKGFMINIGFDKLFHKISYILPRPDKSLIDCVSRSDLNQLVL